MFSSSDELATHMSQSHDTADKVILINRSESFWTASTLAGDELFQVDHSDLVQADPSSPLNVGDLRDRIAKLMRANGQTLSFLGEGKELSDNNPLEHLSMLVVKQTMLIERSQKMHALDERQATENVKH
jgi:hypothetical protein